MNGYQYNFYDEMIVDHFCGGGGASTGIELALNRIVDVAVNHDINAIRQHEVNHPYTKHYLKDVFEVDPHEATSGRKIMLMWLSPDCTHFSKAKGSTPVKKEIRGLAWLAVKWAAAVKPRVIMLENVPEFVTWGPIKNGRPIKEKKGETFKQFIEQLKKLGYIVQWRTLCADDYGAATSRKRLVLIARSDGKPIVWPKPTHGDGKGLKPKHTAAEFINFAKRGKSIFDRKKPLATATMKRIARGLDKFTIKNKKPFIVPIGYGERKGQAPRTNDIDKPLGTIVTAVKHNIVNPILTPYITQTEFNNGPQDACQPITTICSVNKHNIVAPVLAPYVMCNNNCNVGTAADAPLHTITTGNRHFLAESALMPFIGSRYGDTIANKSARGKSIDEPLPTITASRDHNDLISAHISKYYSGEYQAGSAVDAPLDTITAIDHNALIENHLCVFRNNMDCKTLDGPLPTITAAAEHFSLISTYLIKYSTNINLLHWPQVRAMLNDYANYTIADDEVLILEINGVPYFIGDIEMRMLEPRELYGCQGFPLDYVIDRGADGTPLTKTEQIRKVGNSVCPPMSCAMVRANFPELIPKRRVNTMKQFNRESNNVNTQKRPVLRLLIGGSPCTHWSIAQKNNRETTASGVGWELFKNYLYAKEKFAPTHFLYENNKSAAVAIKAQIAEELHVFHRNIYDAADNDNGVRFTEINSALLSAQNRKRFYVTSFWDISQPKDKKICLRDIIDGFSSANTKSIATPARVGGFSSAQAQRIYSIDGKSVTINAGGGGQGGKTGLYAIPICVAQRGRYTADGKVEQNFEARLDGKTNTITTVSKDNLVAVPIILPLSKAPGLDIENVYEVLNGHIAYKRKKLAIRLPDGLYIIRNLSVKECRRLQTIPDWYVMPCSDAQNYKMLGNGWTVEVIKHLLSHIPNLLDYDIQVLSMYDGMSCGQIALKELGANVVKYVSYEIDKYCIQTTQTNFPNTIQRGDAFGLRADDWSF